MIVNVNYVVVVLLLLVVVLLLLLLLSMLLLVVVVVHFLVMGGLPWSESSHWVLVEAGGAVGRVWDSRCARGEGHGRENGCECGRECWRQIDDVAE